MIKTNKIKMNKLPVERMIELEYFFKDKVITNEVTFIDICYNYKMEETLYLISAYKMPMDSINEQLNIYDRDKLNSVNFVNILAKRYSVSVIDVINRIHDIRKINLYLDKQNKKRLK